MMTTYQRSQAGENPSLTSLLLIFGLHIFGWELWGGYVRSFSHAAPEQEKSL
jgi:hypothetical protein